MRTTVAIDDQVLDAARSAARQRGTTLGELITEALRRALTDAQPVPGPVLPTFTGGTGPRPGVELRSNRALTAWLDPPADRTSTSAPR